MFGRILAKFNSYGASPFDFGAWVDCTRNGFDVGPAAESVVAQVKKTLQDKANNNKPIVILAGEFHGAPAHILAQQKLLARLEEEFGRDAIAFGYELPHNLCERSFEKVGHRVTPESKGVLNLVTAITNGLTEFAPPFTP